MGNHYETLGVARSATAKEINAAYKRLALALHPDKCAYGSHLMKQINEAKAVLLDDAERRRYDQTLDRGSTSSGGSGESSLQRALKQSEHKRQMLKMQVSTLQAQLAVARANQSTPPRNSYEVNRLQSKLQRSEEKSRRLQSKVDQLKSDNRSLQFDLQQTERKNDHLSSQNEYLEEEASAANEKIENAVLEQKRQSEIEMARQRDEMTAALKAERDRSKIEVERVRRSMAERTLCYRCNGRGAECTLCQGYGSVQGKWTKCLKCNGEGSFASVGGMRVFCDACFAKGAREGISLTVDCFKCKGAGNECKVCYRGKIRAFNVKPCPFCKGKGCENCLEKGYVSCQCGWWCNGHRIDDDMPKYRGRSR